MPAGVPLPTGRRRLAAARSVVLARFGREGTVAAWGGPAAAVIAELRYTQRAWGPRPVAGDDVMAHVLRAQWGIGHVWLHGHLDGFLPTFAAGYQEFLFFGPGFTAVIAVLRAVTLWQLSTVGAMKVLAIASLVFFPIAVSFLARSYGLSRRAAGIAAVLCLLVNNPFGVGLSAVFGPFLVPQQLGAILACVCIGGVLRMMTEPGPRWIVVVATSAALILVTHIITAFIVIAVLVLTLPTLIVTDRPSRRALARIALGALGAVGLAGFWFIPFLVHRGLHGPVTTWATPRLVRRLSDVVAGRYLLRPVVGGVLLGGAVLALGRVVRRRRWALALVAVPVGFVALCRALVWVSPNNEIAIQLENRGIGFAAVIGTFSLAAVLGWLARLGAGRMAGYLADAVGVTAAVVLVAATSGPWINIAGQQPVPSPGLAGAARFLRTWLPPGARIAEVRQYPQDVAAAGGVQHPDFFLASATGHPTLNEFNVESTSATAVAFTAEHLLLYGADGAADDLAKYGVAAIVSTSAETTRDLGASERLRDVWHASGWTVMEVVPQEDRPAPATLLWTEGASSARVDAGATDPSRLRLVVTAPAPTSGSVAVAWSPRWRLRVDGRRVRARRSPDGLVAVDLPAGRSVVELRWTGDPWAGVGLVMSALTGVVGLAAVGGARRADRRKPRVGA